jgi:hypothetical protein
MMCAACEGLGVQEYVFNKLECFILNYNIFYEVLIHFRLPLSKILMQGLGQKQWQYMSDIIPYVKAFKIILPSFCSL